MPTALTRAVPGNIAACELTHLDREPIDVARAEEQHREYEAALAALGCIVRRIPDAHDLPDSVFVEDTAVVLDDVAVITRPGAESRRPEIESVSAELSKLRSLAFLEAPATLDGGDVLRIGSRLFVGSSGRTNADAITQLSAIAQRHGMSVTAVPVDGCLHLKSAVTAVDETTVLLNPRWVDAAHFDGYRIVEVDATEPNAANVLPIGGTVLCSAAHPRTQARLDDLGYTTRAVDLSELAKAEGALTCCSLIVG